MTLRELPDLVEEDLSFITCSDKRHYLQVLQKMNVRCPTELRLLKECIENKEIPVEIRMILSNCLEFNPYFRPSASECLMNPIFDDVRNLDEELIGSRDKLFLQVDQESTRYSH